MLELHNGMERSRDEWMELLHNADPRFKEVRIHVPPRSKLGIIEVYWVGSETKCIRKT